MGRRTADERTRVANPAAAAAELAEHYARILGQQADRQVSDVIRTCLRRLPSRLPIQGEDLRAVEELIERVLRLGEVGAIDPNGSPRQIDDYIARRLGASGSGHRSVYRALRAMLGHTVLVERCSRQIWVLRLAGLTDPSSKLHLALLAETPALYSLAASGTDTAGGSEAMRTTARGGDEPLGTQPSRPLDADPSHEPRAEPARLDEELAAERRARAEADKRREAIDTELEPLRRALDEERHARSEADVRAHAAVVQLAALERELGPLRRERDAADLRFQASAAQITLFRQELAEVQDALAKERRARDEAEERSQAAAAQLVALEQKLGPQHRALDEQCRALRDAVETSHAASAAQIAALERELESAREMTRDVQAADAATVWRLIEANQPQEAVTFLVARMHGRNVEDPIEAIPRLRQPRPCCSRLRRSRRYSRPLGARQRHRRMHHCRCQRPTVHGSSRIPSPRTTRQQPPIRRRRRSSRSRQAQARHFPQPRGLGRSRSWGRFSTPGRSLTGRRGTHTRSRARSDETSPVRAVRARNSSDAAAS